MSSYNPGSGFTQTSNYGNRTHPVTGVQFFHGGNDYGAAAGTSIPAAADGTVVYSGYINGYGNTVVIRHTSDGHKLFIRYMLT